MRWLYFPAGSPAGGYIKSPLSHAHTTGVRVHCDMTSMDIDSATCDCRYVSSRVKIVALCLVVRFPFSPGLHNTVNNGSIRLSPAEAPHCLWGFYPTLLYVPPDVIKVISRSSELRLANQEGTSRQFIFRATYSQQWRINLLSSKTLRCSI